LSGNGMEENGPRFEEKNDEVTAMTDALSGWNPNAADEMVYRFMTLDQAGHWGMDINCWDWVPGVGVISILDYYETTRKPELLEFLIRWINKNKDKADGGIVINSVAPYAVFPALYRYTEDDWYRTKALEIAAWIAAEAPRTREGAFEHTVTEKESFPEQVWADTIFMAVLFLARLARLTESREYAREALHQLDLHLQLLQDPETGVLFHGWDCGASSHMSAARWTRANGWVAAGTPEIIREVRDIVDIPDGLKRRYRDLIEGLVRYQAGNGLWHTVMDRPSFYPEASGSAGIACGIAKSVKLGLLHESLLPAAEKTLSAILSVIADTGEVRNVSGGTPVMKTVEAYNEIPQYPTLYGQGLALMLLSSFWNKGVV
jgi:unsaturated rhamnogalacturonyl hydrolase